MFSYKRPIEFEIEKLIEITIPLYHQAFLLSPVWHEDLSIEEITNRLKYAFAKEFDGVWATDSQNNQLAGTSWYEFTNLSILTKERGEGLAAFISSQLSDNPNQTLVWQRETLVNPDYWGLGLSKDLKRTVLAQLQHYARERGPLLVLTRMREDNVRILAVNQELGMLPTDVTQPCSLHKDKTHQFWYQVIR